jgi:hypothetical protein
MRNITDHKLNGLNEAFDIIALDAPGPGGANHIYAMLLKQPAGQGSQSPVISTESVSSAPIMIEYLENGDIRIQDTSAGKPLAYGVRGSCIVRFQKGPIGEAGINGISGEILMAIQIDRLRGFQHKRAGGLIEHAGFDFNSRGEYACRENAVALTNLEDSLMWLQKRTRDRLARGVEGTHAV